MKNYKEIDLFSDTSSSSSQFESPFIRKQKDFFKDEDENEHGFFKKSEKIVEKTPISDSDSSTYQGKMNLVDMTYEKFIERKKSLSKKNDLEERIKELQRDISFNNDDKGKEKMFDNRKTKKNNSSEGKIYEKYKEIANLKETSMKKDRTSIKKGACFQELEEMKKMNKHLREKLQNERSSNKENKVIEKNHLDNEKLTKEMFLLEKIDHLRTHLNSLIIKKKIGASTATAHKDKQKTTLKNNKPINFLKEAHCKNCAKLLSKGIPTNFCTYHNNYKNNTSAKKIF